MICVVYIFTVFVFSSSAEVLPAKHRPATAKSDHSALMDQDNAMHMSMQMSFEASTAVTLWFKQWHTHSLGTYLLSCAGLVALCLFHEILHAYRNAFHEQYVTPQAQSEYDRFQAPAETAEDGSSSKGSMNPTVARAVHSLLYAVNLACSYLLMLAVMTFNIGYFFVVVAGLAIGNFLFGGSKSSDVCHAQS